MILPLLFGLFGSIWFYASNSVLRTGVELLPQRLDEAFSDVNLYIDNTVKQVDHLAVDNFGEVKSGFKSLINETGGEVGTIFDEIKNATRFDDLVSLGRSIAGQVLVFNNQTLVNLESKINKTKEKVVAIKNETENIKVTFAALIQTPGGIRMCGELGSQVCQQLDTTMTEVLTLINQDAVPAPAGDVKLEDVRTLPKDWSTLRVPNVALQ